MISPPSILDPVNTQDPVNRAYPLNQGKIGWWLTLPGLLGSSKWYDLFGMNPGNLSGFTSLGWAGTVRRGGFGELGFNGGSSVDCTNADPRFNFTTGNFTISFWAKFSSLASGPVVLNRGTFAVSGYYVFISGAGVLELQCESTGADNAISTAAGFVAAGLWHHYVLVRTGTTTGAIYKDGIATSTTGSLGNCTSSTNPLQFGQYSGGTNRVGGSLDDIGIWNRALSASEVFALYQDSLTGYPDSLNRIANFIPAPAPSGATVNVDGIKTGELWGMPTLTTGPLTVSVSGIQTAEAWGAPSVLVPTTVNVSGIKTGEAWGNPTVGAFHIATFNYLISVFPNLSPGYILGLRSDIAEVDLFDNLRQGTISYMQVRSHTLTLADERKYRLLRVYVKGSGVITGGSVIFTFDNDLQETYTALGGYNDPVAGVLLQQECLGTQTCRESDITLTLSGTDIVINEMLFDLVEVE